MNSIAINQILILLLQCIIVAVLLLSLFRLRTIFGMGLLFTALGVFQYMQVFLAASLYIEVIPGILVSPGSMVMFTGSLFAVLLIYIREDALEARKVIYALLAANLVLALLQIIFSWVVEGEFVTNIYNLPKEFFTVNSRFLFVGTIVLFIDAFVIIFIYEAIARKIPYIFLRILITMTLVLAIDTILFSLGAFTGTDQFRSILVSGLVSKFSSAIVYTALFSVYLVYIEKGLKKNEIGTSSFEDIFHTLTYRQKFEQAYKESKIQKIELQQSEDYNRLLFDTSPTGLALCTMDGSLVDVNPAYAEILGYTIDETLKLTYWDITPQKYSDQEALQIKSLEETGKYGPYEKEYINKDGDLVSVVLSGVIVEKDDQRYIMSSVEDISERKQFEKALQNNEARLSEAQHIAKIGSWDLDLISNKLIWSNEVYQIFGIEQQITDVTFDIFMEYIHPDDRDMVSDAYANSVKNKKPYNIVHRILLKNRIIKYVHEICETYYDDTDKPIRSLGTVQDITERKLAEDELKKRSLELEALNSFGRSLSSKLELKDVLNTALKGIHTVVEPDITFIFIREGDKLILSNLHPINAESKLGDIPEHRVGECICGRTVQEKNPMFSIDIFEDNRCTWNECKQAGIKSFAALPLMNKDEVIGVIGLASNTERDFEKEVKFLETMVGQVSITMVNAQLYDSVQMELEERKRAQVELRQTHEKLTDTLENMTDGFVSLDNNWIYTYVNKRAGVMFDRKHEDLVGKHIWTEFPEGIDQPFYKNYYKAVETQIPIIIEEHYQPWDLWFENSIIPSKDGLAIFFQDITQRKKDELELKEKGRFIESVVNLSLDVLYIYDLVERRNIYSNDGITKVLGYSIENVQEMGEQLIPLLMHPDDFQAYLNDVVPRYARVKDDELIEHQYRMKDKSGNWHWLNSREFIYKRLPDGAPKQIFGEITDITERQKAEMALVESEEKHRNLLNNLNAGVVVHGPDTSIIFNNPKASELLGLSNDQLRGRQAIDPVWKFLSENGTPLSHEEYPVDKIIKSKKYLSNMVAGLIRPDTNDIIWVLVNGYPVLDKHGEIFEIIIAFIDITDRKHVEALIKESSANLKALLDNRNDSIWSLNLDYNYIIFNKPYADIFFSENNIELISGMNALERLQPEIQEFWKSKFEPAFNGKSVDFEFMHNISGKDHYFQVLLNPIVSDGIVTGASALSIDITEQKLAREKFIEQSKKAQQYLDIAGVMLVSINEDGLVNLINPKGCEILGYSNDDILGNNWFDNFLTEKDRQKVKEDSKKIFSGEIESLKYYENEVITKSGELRLIAWRNVLIKDENGKITGILSSGNDITEMNLAEKALHQSEEKFRSFVEQASEGIYLLELENPIPITMPLKEQIKNIYRGCISEANDSYAKMYGFECAEELVGVSLTQLHGGIENPLNIEFIKSWIEAGYRISGVESEEFDKDGNKIWFSNNIIGFIENGFLQRLWGTQTNITAQKEANEELGKFANRLQILHKMDKYILAAESPEKLALSVLQDMANFISFKIATVTEYDEACDSFTRVLVFPDGFDSNVDNKPILTSEYEILDLKLLRSGKVQIVEDLRKKRTNYKNAQWLIDKGLYSLVLIPLISESKLLGTINFAGESMDVFPPDKIEIATEVANQLAISFQQWKLREEIISYTEELEQKVKQRTEQLEHSNQELREFAQIVSHDLKAPLRAISQLSYWVWKDYSDKIDEEGQKKLEMIMGRVKRLDNLIEGILQYSRAGRQREKEIPVNLQLLVEDSITLLDPPSNISIVIENQLPEYIGDPTRLGQLFQNLINNAIKFMDKPNGIIKIGCKKDSDSWQFYISDNGPGIEEKYFNRIFQIFQRLVSRDEQEGTGIGLSLAKRIVQIYGGEIWLTSTIGEGSTFYFTLRL